MDLFAFITDFYAAYQRGDIAALRLAPDLVHQSPIGTVEGRDQFDQNCAHFAPFIERIEIKNHLTQGHQICAEVVTVSAQGTHAMCEWFTVEQGLVTKLVSYFDASHMR